MTQRSASGITFDTPPRISRRIKLVCAACGLRHTYDAGTIYHWKEGDGDSARVRYAFSNYFRCRECGAAGPWEIAEYGKLLASTLAAVVSGGNERVVAAKPVLFDGTTHQTPAMGEEHLLRLIGNDPGNAFLHTRLGNLLRGCHQTARSAEWYEKAVALDAGDIEARVHLFNFALETGDVPATLKLAPLLVRHLLKGRTTNRDDLTQGMALFVSQTLRQLPEIRAEFDVSGAAAAASPERTFIRTLLEQSGDENDILKDAADRLLRGKAVPAESSRPAVPALLGDVNDQTATELIPSLRDVVEQEGLDARVLSVALATDPQGRLHVNDRHSVFVSDGTKAGVWHVPSLRALFRGRKAPPLSMDHYPPEYSRYFFSVEKHVLAVGGSRVDPTDQEMESIYSALRRRPDGKSFLGPTHDFLWQVGALTLGMYVLSEAEFQAIVGRLERSVRTWAQRPVSRNYVRYLRDNLL